MKNLQVFGFIAYPMTSNTIAGTARKTLPYMKFNDEKEFDIHGHLNTTMLKICSSAIVANAIEVFSVDNDTNDFN